MPTPRKIKRNKDLIKKRRAGWSYRQLAKYFNIDVRAAWEICQRDLYKKCWVFHNLALVLLLRY